MNATALPVDEALPALRAALAAAGAAVLEAPPGAGKTTRVPPALAAWLGEGAGKVVVLEPRRVAARAAARRIAAERGWEIGREVGWWIRFERRFGARTRVVFVTEGLLLRWLERDPLLDGVGALVFDEFHERALASDLALALARELRGGARPELRLVVMSATLDGAAVARFLGGVPVVTSAGRPHPLSIRGLERPDARPLEQQVATAVRRLLAEVDGDVLVFLPGAVEIRRAGEALAALAREAGVDVVALHGGLSGEEQDAALRAAPRRRVVLATNLAETSVTVEGVRAVVDSGLVRRLRHDAASGLDRLETVRVSRASADQRAGRAARLGPGRVERLWHAADDLALRPFELPEIERVDLAPAVLALLSWGELDPARFGWFEPPDPARLERATRELRDLGALDEGGLTAVGRRLAELPLPPRLGRLALEGERLGVAADAALAAALLAERDPLPGRDARSRPGSRSDLADRLAELDPRRHRALFAARDQILALLQSSTPGDELIPGKTETSIERKDFVKADAVPKGASRSGVAAAAKPRGARSIASLLGKPLSLSEKEENLRRAIAAAYLDRLCRRREPGSDRALMVGGRGVRLARTSAVRDAELFVAVDVDARRGGERAEGLVRVASEVERAWLPAGQLAAADELAWDGAGERVVALRRTRFDDLVLDEKEIPVPDASAAAALLAERAADDLSRPLALDGRDVAPLLARLRFLAGVRPELGLPASTGELLRAALPLVAAGRRSFAELRRAPLAATLLATLTREQRRALDELAPERLELPSGSKARIDYSDPQRPVLAVRIQELFGLDATPRLAGGRAPLLLHLLAPNGRPQQVTDDLAGFWRNTYPQVRKELAGRYPKHAWPLDPLAAKPGRRSRNR